ncbi:MAG: hypothetical protein K0R65_218 [Crocinitomicaceae bacterium]|jgi:hypothetical protein|nr:hypothetical protein [Crocinitomicaceae bacterium]
MISWATKADQLGELTDTVNSTCKVCSAENKAVYTVIQNYFLLYWMPVFPTKREIYKTCPSCTFHRKLKKTDSGLLDTDFSPLEQINARFPKKLKLKYFWGTFVFAAIFGLIAWFIINS